MIRETTNGLANLRLMFPNSGGEYDTVEPAQRIGKRRDFPSNPERKSSIVSRASGAGLLRRSRLSALMPEVPSRPE